eukprot:m.227349 g.227349  ORF g.227349 m.227349 type:complete len:52 (+) comp15175_c1_seq20:118-273(+)
MLCDMVCTVERGPEIHGYDKTKQYRMQSNDISQLGHRSTVPFFPSFFEMFF